MNYDQYIEEAKKYSSDEAVNRLVAHLSNWKFDNTTVIELADSVERLFDNSWISDEKTHTHLYTLWANFHAQTIATINAMTINERLYWFGLMEYFENTSESEKKYVYKKLCADM